MKFGTLCASVRGFIKEPLSLSLFKICIEFFAFNCKDVQDVSSHVAVLRGLWNELNTGLKERRENILPENILICMTLHILLRSHDVFKSSWILLTQHESKTSDYMFAQLEIFERNINHSHRYYLGRSKDNKRCSRFTFESGFSFAVERCVQHIQNLTWPIQEIILLRILSVPMYQKLFQISGYFISKLILMVP